MRRWPELRYLVGAPSWQSHLVLGSASTRSWRRLALAAWARCIARKIRSYTATSPSKFCQRRSPSSRIAWPGSSAKRSCSRPWIIPTSPRFTGRQSRPTCARWPRSLWPARAARSRRSQIFNSYWNASSA